MRLQKFVSALLGGMGVLVAFNGHAISLNPGNRLTIEPGNYAGGTYSGSFFVVDFNGDGGVTTDEQSLLSQGTQGIVIGRANTGAGEITEPWPFLGVTGYDWTSTPITGGTDGVNLSGWTVNFNGHDNPVGTGAWQVTNASSGMPTSGYRDGIAIFNWSGVYGDSYTLDYTATAQSGPFQGIPWALHLQGTVLVPEASAYAMMLAGLGLVGLATRRRRIVMKAAN